MDKASQLHAIRSTPDLQIHLPRVKPRSPLGRPEGRAGRAALRCAHPPALRADSPGRGRAPGGRAPKGEGPRVLLQYVVVL